MLYLTKISNAGSEFTENEQKIADFLQANVSELQSVSSRKMAKQLGISQSSIVKFAQKLGAQGFTELRMALIGEYSASREKTNATALHLHSSITSDDSLEVIARKLNREKELALEQTCALFDYARLQKIIDVISKAQFIQITGLGGSALVGARSVVQTDENWISRGLRSRHARTSHRFPGVEKRRCTNRYLLQRQ